MSEIVEPDHRSEQILSLAADKRALEAQIAALREELQDTKDALFALTQVEKVKEREASIAALREALTPSAATKAAYIGEFLFTHVSNASRPRSSVLTVPWTTIKEIMAAIRARAALAATEPKGEAE